MIITRLQPELWEPIAQLVAALRILLRKTAPQAVAAISAEARALLAAATALVRRYIHVLAAGIELPAAPQKVASESPPTERVPSRRSSLYRFPLAEGQVGRASRHCEPESPELQWAILWEAAARLVSVMANPLPHARRLARRLRREGTVALRELPVRWHVIRRLGPGVDNLLMRLDQFARPEAWEGLFIDTG